MRVLIQRASEASVRIDGNVHGEINRGLVVLLGIESEDTQDDINWLVRKLIGLRIFSDEEGKMNLSVADIEGEFLVISQFTLHASTKKGNRPSYIKAARPELAIPLYEEFIRILRKESGLNVATGSFGADMKVQLINDGPVTIWIDSKNRE
ncbi:MAG: D-tyrosyl-tRNA(Tyr) deacylase [Flavobacteriales bacterium]|nr:D-tyrosyl-tRNA(Tyr) deacylase [Flavobacteriales bacterium]